MAPESELQMRLKVSYSQWLRGTDFVQPGTLQVPRSYALRRIDNALIEYEGLPSVKNLRKLSTALDEWKNGNGAADPWLRGRDARRTSLRPTALEVLKQRVLELMKRTPVQTSNNYQELDDDEWFLVNTAKRFDSITAQPFAGIDLEEYNCFTYTQHRTLTTLETSNPKGLAECDDTYGIYIQAAGGPSYARVYPDPKDFPAKGSWSRIPKVLSDSEHSDLLKYEPEHTKVVVYGKPMDAWQKPTSFCAEHHVLRVPRGYEGKQGALEPIFHRTLKQVTTHYNGVPRLVYRQL
jgi:hypothetical protein